MDGRDRGGVQARKSEIQRGTTGATRWQARRHEGRDGEGEKGVNPLPESIQPPWSLPITLDLPILLQV